MNNAKIELTNVKASRGYQGFVFPKFVLEFPVHLYYDFKTGLIIGAIHAYCNIISLVYKEIIQYGE